MPRFASSLAQAANPCARDLTRQATGASRKTRRSQNGKLQHQGQQGSSDVPQPQGLRHPRRALEARRRDAPDRHRRQGRGHGRLRKSQGPQCRVRRGLRRCGPRPRQGRGLRRQLVPRQHRRVRRRPVPLRRHINALSESCASDLPKTSEPSEEARAAQAA